MIDALTRDRRLRAASNALAAALPFVFLVAGIVRAYPFADDVLIPAKTPDDWHTYKQFAASVLQESLAMPAVAGSYAGLPHGFLYVYFLAFVFAVFGVNSTYVYVVQSLGLGLSISLMYLAVRSGLSAAGGFAFLLALAALMYVDVFRHLTFKLLSENLYLCLFPLMLLLLSRAIERGNRKLGYLVWAGLVLGLIVLTRPSFVLSAVCLIAAIGIASLIGRRSSWPAGLMLLGFAAGVSAALIRNYVATGHATFDIVTDTSDWYRIWNLAPLQFLDAIARRTAFVFGLTGPLKPEYRMRLHWMILWLLWTLYPIFTLFKRRRFELPDLLLYIYVVCYVGPVVLVAADITSYGGRMVIAILPVVLVSVCRLLFGSGMSGVAGLRSASTGGPGSK